MSGILVSQPERKSLDWELLNDKSYQFEIASDTTNYLFMRQVFTAITKTVSLEQKEDPVLLHLSKQRTKKSSYILCCNSMNKKILSVSLRKILND